MGIRSSLAAIRLTPRHLTRSAQRGFDANALMRSAMTKIGEAIRDLALILATAAPDDPNRVTIEAQIEALR